MRSSLKDQLSLEELRQEFEKFAELRVARELPDFYKVLVFTKDFEAFGWGGGVFFCFLVLGTAWKNERKPEGVG